MKDTYTIDASGRTLGRVASEAAHVLLGKGHAGFVKNEVVAPKVVITNASKLSIPERRKTKTYVRYTGYPGGLKTTTLAELLVKKGYQEIITKAITGMIPRNKLRPIRLKLLTITD